MSAPPDTEALAKLLDAADKDWCVYGELDVGLPHGLFAGKIGEEGFGPIEPLSGANLELAALAPALAAQRISDAARIAGQEAALAIAAETERNRIADELQTYADCLPCREDAEVARSIAILVRANFSHEEAEALETDAEARP